MKPNDIVRTNLGLQYRVVVIDSDRDIVHCWPLSQPHWREIFTFHPSRLSVLDAKYSVEVNHVSN